MPTRFGFLYAGFLVLILLGAINYSNSLGHVLCFLLASMGLIAMLYTYRNLANIELQNAYAQTAFYGQNVTFILTFSNPDSKDSYHLTVSTKRAREASWNPLRKLAGYINPHLISRLSSQRETRLDYKAPSLQRGKQPLGRVRVASAFPLGLYTVWSYFKNDYQAIVYPKPTGSLPLPNPIGEGHQDRRELQQKERGTDDFSGFNRYRTGDPLRAIAWKAMARDDMLRTKQFTSLKTTTDKIMLNRSDVAHLPDIEAQLSQLCRWILDAEAAGFHYGLTLDTDSIDYGQGELHCHTCLKALALYE